MTTSTKLSIDGPGIQEFKGYFTRPKVTGCKCPWQNGVAEPYVLSARDDALNRMGILFNFIKFGNNFLSLPFPVEIPQKKLNEMSKKAMNVISFIC
ncbi:MAG: hypothetical protein GY699_26255 [Desulfobacteraceae bacterium]|nr:hypothetical protein [Desulfobacteraceae bacterium]